jgi:hypothetical protein
MTTFKADESIRRKLDDVHTDLMFDVAEGTIANLREYSIYIGNDDKFRENLVDFLLDKITLKPY